MLMITERRKEGHGGEWMYSLFVCGEEFGGEKMYVTDYRMKREARWGMDVFVLVCGKYLAGKKNVLDATDYWTEREGRSVGNGCILVDM